MYSSALTKIPFLCLGAVVQYCVVLLVFELLHQFWPSQASPGADFFFPQIYSFFFPPTHRLYGFLHLF